MDAARKAKLAFLKVALKACSTSSFHAKQLTSIYLLPNAFEIFLGRDLRSQRHLQFLALHLASAEITFQFPMKLFMAPFLLRRLILRLSPCKALQQIYAESNWQPTMPYNNQCKAKHFSTLLRKSIQPLPPSLQL